jgi:formylglycine-generating enzyme required for sulfatase activity
MRRLSWLALAGLLSIMACTPARTPAPTLPPPTLTPEPPPTAVPSPTEIPALAPAALAGPQAASSMRWLDGVEMVYVSAGDFTMGTGIGSTPEKSVSLDGFWIYTTDVTNKMYAQCVTTGNCAPPAQEVGAPVYTNPQYGDFPVVGVTWDMANNYCAWAQADLPTEAQWEKAARGENAAVFPWGINQPSCSLLNFKGCVGHTTNVTDFPDGRSPYGAFDMAGNVFQWVKDFYDEHAYDAMPNKNPTGPGSGTSHVIRGSSYESESKLLPSGVRHFGAKDYHSPETGFRCAVNQPKVLAPFCQMDSYIPTGAGPTGSACELPQTGVQRNYCAAKIGYATITIPDGATYRITTKGYSCSDAIVNGERLLTCSGPDSSSGKVQVCNTACGGAPAETGAPIVCDPGYDLNASTLTCNYAPTSSAPAVSGCPVGYNLIARGDQKICAVGRNQNGQCPIGTYFDGQYGACVSPLGGADVPYGIDNATLASQAFQGCAAGYNYDATYQCCQATAGGAYPGCPVGFVFDNTQNTCVPQKISVSAPGCVSVMLNIADCTPVVDVCTNITYEGTCLRNPACEWDDRKGLCLLKKPSH